MTPEAALASIGDAHRDLADRVSPSLLEDLWYGASVAALVAANALFGDTALLFGLVLLGSILSLGLFVRRFRARTGVWVSGARRGKTRPLMVAFGLFLAAAAVAGWFIGGDGHTSLALALVVVAGVVSAAANHAWMVIYQRELRAS